MAEQIAAVVVARPSRRSQALNRYVSTEKAGQAKGERFVAASGINGCIPELAEKQMCDNRKRWGKNGTTTDEGPTGKIIVGQYVQAYHVIQSFARDGLGALDPDNPNDWEKAHELGVQLARKVAGKERLATVHTQIDGKTGCVHNHIVIDSIDKTTGRSFDSSNVKHKILTERHDRVLKDSGFNQVNDYPQDGTTKGAEKFEKSELRGLARHQQWEAGDRKEPEPFSVSVLKNRIRRALADESFTTFDEFVDVADDHEVQVEQRGESGRGIVYAMIRWERWEKEDYLPFSSSDRRRASKLGRDFMMDAVNKAIQRNIDLAKQKQSDRVVQQHTAPEPQEAQTTATTKFDGKGPSEAGSRQPSLRTSAIPDIGADVDRQLRESGVESAGEALLRKFQGKASPAAPQEHQEGQDTAQPSGGPQDDANEDTATSAPAPVREDDEETTENAPSAAAPSASGEDEGYRSPLRDATSKSEDRRAFYARVAEFDEEAREVLSRGERIDEATVPKGIGAHFLKDFSDQLDSTVAEQLRLRQTKKEKVNAAFEAGKKAQAEIDEIKTKAEQGDDLTGMWMHTKPTQELIREKNVANRRREKLREEIAQGVYEDVRGRAPAVLGYEEQDEPQRQQDGPSLG